MNVAQRRAALVEYLRRQVDHVSTQNLADEFDVGISTVERDLSALRSQGYRIAAQQGRSGGVVLESLPDQPHLEISRDNRNTFVGRSRELEVLSNALRSASISGSMVFVSGGSGVGKTRLVEELKPSQKVNSPPWIQTSSLENFQAPPLWPWISVLESTRELISDTPELDSERTGLIEAMTSESSSVESDHADSAHSRFILFERLFGYLKKLSNNPIVIVLDDIQWMDAASLAFVEYLGSSISTSKILLIGVYDSTTVTRTTALGRSMGTISRSNSVQRISLGPLRENEAMKMIEFEAGSSLSLDHRSRIFERTEGNPFFIKEVTKWIEDNDNRDLNPNSTESLVDQIPEGILDVVGRRLARLSSECAELLGKAAVLGREFEAGDLNLVANGTDRTSIDPVAISAILDEAIDSGLVTQISPSGVFAFTHSMIHAAILNELSLSEQTRLHANAAEALDHKYESNREQHAELLARHYLAAAPLLGSERAVYFSMISGQKAMQKYGFQDAATHFNNILDLSWDRVDDNLRYEALGRLGQAKAAFLTRGEKYQSIDDLKEAITYFISTEQSGIATELALTDVVPVNEDSGFGRGTDICGMIELVIDHVEPDSLEHGGLLARYSLALVSERSNFPASREASDAASRIANLHQDPILKLMADRANLALQFREPVDRAEFAAAAKLVARDAQRLGNMQSELRARWYLLSTLMAHGSQIEAETAAIDLRERAERFGETGSLQQAIGMRSNLAVRFGKWDLARELVDESLIKFDAPEFGTSSRNNTTIYTGNKSQLERLAKFVSLTTATESFWKVGTAIGLFINRPNLIDDQLLLNAMNVCEDAVTSAQNRHEELAVELLIGLVKIYSGDQDSLEHTQNLLGDPLFPTLLIVGIHPERLRARIAQLQGHPKIAMSHIERAIEFYEKNECLPELSLSLVDYAEIKLEIGDDLDGVSQLIERAVEISNQLGMTVIDDRVIQLNNRLDEIKSGAPVYPNGLSGREFEVLLLIADGKTNREISDELFISNNTVTRHITNIFSKIDVANRSEATAYVFRNDLKVTESPAD